VRYHLELPDFLTVPSDLIFFCCRSGFGRLFLSYKGGLEQPLTSWIDIIADMNFPTTLPTLDFDLLFPRGVPPAEDLGMHEAFVPNEGMEIIKFIDGF